MKIQSVLLLGEIASVYMLWYVQTCSWEYLCKWHFCSLMLSFWFENGFISYFKVEGIEQLHTVLDYSAQW